MKHIVYIISTLAASGLAQDRAATSAKAATFDVVSVRAVPPDRPGRYESYCADGGRFISRGVPMTWAIQFAYSLTDYQITENTPGWLKSFGTYDIEAETEARVTEDQCKAMVRSIFEDRFQLSMHQEIKTVSAYGLVVGKTGAKLLPRGRVTINGAVKHNSAEREPPEGWTMARLANYLSSVKVIGRPVTDRTGLPGSYSLNLNYSTNEGDDRPDVFAAVAEQLGLRLESIKAPIAFFVIDHVAKPDAN